MTLIPTGSQTIGPFFREALERPAWSDLTRDGVPGEAVRIEGVVRDGDGIPVPDALLELWQADADGRERCTVGQVRVMPSGAAEAIEVWGAGRRATRRRAESERHIRKASNT